MASRRICGGVDAAASYLTRRGRTLPPRPSLMTPLLFKHAYSSSYRTTSVSVALKTVLRSPVACRKSREGPSGRRLRRLGIIRHFGDGGSIEGGKRDPRDEDEDGDEAKGGGGEKRAPRRRSRPSSRRDLPRTSGGGRR